MSPRVWRLGQGGAGWGTYELAKHRTQVKRVGIQVFATADSKRFVGLDSAHRGDCPGTVSYPGGFWWRQQLLVAMPALVPPERSCSDPHKEDRPCVFVFRGRHGTAGIPCPRRIAAARRPRNPAAHLRGQARISQKRGEEGEVRLLGKIGTGDRAVNWKRFWMIWPSAWRLWCWR